MAITLYGDNGGGLHMTDGATVVSGLELGDPGQLVEDMTTYDDWVGTTTCPVMDAAEFGSFSGYQEIARYDGGILTIDCRHTGLAGRRYAGLPRE